MPNFEDQYDDESDLEDTPRSQPTRRRNMDDTPPRGTRRQPDYDEYYEEETRPQPRRRAMPPPPPEYYPPQPAQAPRSAKRPPKPTPSKRDNGLYLPWWSLLIMLVFVGCAAVGALLVVQNMETNPPVGGQTPIVIVITATYTVGPPAPPPTVALTATLTPTPPLPTIPPTASLPPGDFAIGKTVEVVGVGVNGLNIHSAAGVNAPVRFQAHDGDRFVLKDGPQNDTDGEWWSIEDPTNTSRSGWASRAYLQAIGGSATP